jgi:3-dehydroquinate synthase
MKKISVHLKERSYDILVGSGLLDQAGKILRRLHIGDCAYIVTNARLRNSHGAILATSLARRRLKAVWMQVPDTEKSKSFAQAARITNDITRRCRLQRVFIIAFGGGVVGDLAGFVAAVYRRGSPFVQIPTTLLAQVDSSIGGKTAVDLTSGKNLAGVFHQPKLVISDVQLLATLDRRQVIAGLAEVVKYAVIADGVLFRFLEKNYKRILAKDPAALEFIVSRSAAIKAKIVSKDERELKFIRTTLNFGHTFGHAIEAALGYRGYNHGEAVALGMLLAVDISVRLGLVSGTIAKRVEALIAALGLPVRIRGVPLSKILKAQSHDKKFTGKKNRFVLLDGLGSTIIREGIPLGLLRQVLAARLAQS